LRLLDGVDPGEDMQTEFGRLVVVDGGRKT
jgi:hypothetical protein